MTDGLPWTIDGVITALPWLGPLRQEEPLHDLSDQGNELCQVLRRALPTTDGLARLNAAVMLLRLQDPAGRDVFLRALSSAQDVPAVASAPDEGGQAMWFLQFLALHDTPYSEDFWGTLPISKAEVFAAVSPHLREPETKLGPSALSVCLRHDIEATRALTRPLLTHRSGERRLHAIREYLRQGRDEGALHALGELFEAAPLNPTARTLAGPT